MVRSAQRRCGEVHGRGLMEKNGAKLYQLGTPVTELKGMKKNEMYNKAAVNEYRRPSSSSKNKRYIDKVSSAR